MDELAQFPSELQKKDYIAIKRIYKQPKTHVYYAIRKEHLAETQIGDGKYDDLHEYVRAVKVLGDWGNDKQRTTAKADIDKEGEFFEAIKSNTLAERVLKYQKDDSVTEGTGDDRYMVLETVYPCITLQHLYKPLTRSGDRIPNALAAHIFLELFEIFAGLHRQVGIAHGDFYKRKIVLGLSEMTGSVLPKMRLIDFAKYSGDPEQLRLEGWNIIDAMLDIISVNQHCGKRNEGHKPEGVCRPDTVHSDGWKEFWGDLASWFKTPKHLIQLDWDRVLSKNKRILESVRGAMSAEEEQCIKNLLFNLFEAADGAKITDSEWADTIARAKSA